VFLITGPAGAHALDKADELLAARACVAVLLTTAIAIAARFVWVFPPPTCRAGYRRPCASATPRRPGPWALCDRLYRVRGVVSLAAALAIPLTVASGAAFPNRDIILSSPSG